MRNFRIALWCLVVVVAGFAGYQFMSKTGKVAQQSQTTSLGAPFNLIRHDGKPITQEALDGRNHALFFGFTHCPDICPTTLLEASGWLKALGDEAEKLDVYFITVDPERDTQGILNDYVSAFDPRITGITGTQEEVEKTLKSYHVYAQKVALEEDDYTMDHTASVLLFRADGSLQGTIAFNENPDTAIEKLRRLIKNG